MAPRYPAFQIGNLTIDPPLVLAPMEDVTALPMRKISKRIGGPGLMFTEFVSAMAIHHGAFKTFKKFRIHPEERPLGIQIFGGEVETLVETARLCQEVGADVIDINMGCWVPKVCKTGSGAALLKDPALAEKIVRSVVAAVQIPVTVKVRAGWDYSLFAAPELAKRFEGAGAKMLTLHARFAKQGFEGVANWDLIRQLRQAIKIPLIGNGDVKTAEDARRMMDETGCDGVMVGRAAISNPWQLGAIRAGIMGEHEPPAPTLRERIDVAIEHARSMVEYESSEIVPVGQLVSPKKFKHDPCQAEQFALRALRGQLPQYIKGENGASSIRAKLSTVSSVAELEDILETFYLRSQSLMNQTVEEVHED